MRLTIRPNVAERVHHQGAVDDEEQREPREARTVRGFNPVGEPSDR